MELIFVEENHLTKTLATAEELEAAYRLRHEVFCDELKWVPRSPDGLEKDAYDSFSSAIGVFDETGLIIGHVRLTFAPNPFMVEKEFRGLLPEGVVFKKPADSVEVTRLCVRREIRLNTRSFLKISNLLYKGVYQLSILNNARFLEMVVEKNNYRLLRLTGFPVEVLGGFKTIGEGVEAGVLLLDLRRFEREAGEKKPEFMRWMSTIQIHNPAQLQLHGLC